jgi:hypothetical protein
MIVETNDSFDIADANLLVVTCRTDLWSLCLELESPDTKWTLVIGGAFSITRNVPDGPIEATQPVDLVGEMVLAVTARKSDGDWRFT